MTHTRLAGRFGPLALAGLLGASLGCASSGGDDDGDTTANADAGSGGGGGGGGGGGDPGAPDAAPGGGGGGGGPGTPDAGEFTPGDGTEVDPEFAPLAAKAYCERVFACCTADELTLFEVIPAFGVPPTITTEAQCRSYIQTFIEELNVLGVLAPFIASGEVRYDTAKRDACNAETAGLACTEFNKRTLLLALGTYCLPVTGTIADGGSCVLDQACVSGHCTIAETCGPRPAVGQPCSSDCADGAWCDAGTCAAKEPNGSECGNADECISAFCDEIYGPGDGLCADITYCDGL